MRYILQDTGLDRLLQLLLRYSSSDPKEYSYQSERSLYDNILARRTSDHARRNNQSIIESLPRESIETFESVECGNIKANVAWYGPDDSEVRCDYFCFRSNC